MEFTHVGLDGLDLACGFGVEVGSFKIFKPDAQLFHLARAIPHPKSGELVFVELRLRRSITMLPRRARIWRINIVTADNAV